MKYNQSALVLAATLLFTAFMGCKKETNAYNANGVTPVFKSSVATIAATPADSLRKVVTFSWTNPKYATDSASEKYVIQIDSSGRNFAKAVSFTVSGALLDSFTAQQINTVALGFGFSYNVAYKMDVRLISSYANNNEQFTSNTITLTVTPYVIPPRVLPPPRRTLFLVGECDGGRPGITRYRR